MTTAVDPGPVDGVAASAACRRFSTGCRATRVAARGPDRGGRGDGADRAEEPRVRGHRGRAVAERALRGRGGRADLPALLHVAADLDGPELVACRRRRWRGGRRRARRRPGGRARRGDRARDAACCSWSMAVLSWAGSRSFLSKAVITGFLAGAAIDVVIGELPKLTGTSTEGDSAWRELGSWLGSLGECTGRRCSSVSPRSLTGGLVLATLVALAPLFSDLPKAVLGAVIIDAVVFGMIDVGELRRLYRVTRFDFYIASAAIVGVLSAGVLTGVVVGVVLSLGWLIYVATAADAAPGPRSGHADLPRPRRAPRRRDDSRDRRGAPRRQPVLRHHRSGREPRPRPARRRPRSRQRSCSISRASTPSTPRVPRSCVSCTGCWTGPASPSAWRASEPRVRSVLQADGAVDRIGADHIHGNVDRRSKPSSAGL